MITEDNKIKIWDFGLSTFVENNIGSIWGTPPFMAPEIILRQKYN